MASNERYSDGESVMPVESLPPSKRYSTPDHRIDRDEFNGTISSKPKSISTDSTPNHNAISSSSKIYSERLLQPYEIVKSKSGSKISDRVKRKSWYNVIYPSYKSRSETFKKLFKEVPDDQRLIVDYSCALQREILVHGRMYVSQDYMCFHANIFGWETYLTLKWTNVTAIAKEKTALVIPNAILISTEADKYFFASFAARDKSYVMLFRVWQNALMNKPMKPQEIWQCVHSAYGERLGLNSDDDDYIDPRIETPQNDMNVDNSKVKPVEKSSSSTETDQSNQKMSGEKVQCESVGAMNGDSASIRSTQAKLRLRKDLEADEIPTDESNSTDSEGGNSIPFEVTAECTSHHEGRQLLHTILPINVDSLLTMLFSRSKFFAEFHNMRKTTNMVYRDWVDNEDGTKTRKLNFTVFITQAVGPKTSNMTEVQTMRACSVPGQLYSIDTKATNAGIPYADSFQTLTHYCLLRTVDDHTMLSVYAEIKYVKHVWGVIKGFIDKNAWAGLENFYKDLLKALQSEYCAVPPAKSKSRRTKRALSQKASIEEDSSKRSSLKSTTKQDSVQSDESQQISSNASKEVNMSTMPQHNPVNMALSKSNARRFFSFGTFSTFIAIAIVVLIVVNCYLLIQLQVLKNKESQSIHLDQELMKQLSGDPNEIRQNWLKLLNQQKVIHEAELVKWEGFVKSAVKLLQNIKNIYTKFNLDGQHTEDIKDEF